MRQSRLLFTLAALIFCSQAFSQFLPIENVREGFVLTYTWPVGKIHYYDDPDHNYAYTKYTKQDFPCFNGDNFAIKSFFPLMKINQSTCNSQFCIAQPIPLGKTKISDADYTYLDKYIQRFGQNFTETEKKIWYEDGSCYNGTQNQFFSTLVNIHKKYNIIKALAAKNIVPHKTKLYQADEILNKPYLYCAFNDDAHANDPRKLVEISLVVDNKLKPTKESQGYCHYSACPDEVIFPPIEF